MSKEKRELFFNTKVEVRTNEEGEKTEFIGFIPYDKRSEDMGFYEVIKQGAFSKTIKESDVKCLVNHNRDKVLGSSRSGSLTFEDTDTGLFFRCRIPHKRSSAQETLDIIESGDADGVSFGFQVIKDNLLDEEGQTIRELKEVRLFEVSLAVPFPAYPDSGSLTRDSESEEEVDLIKPLEDAIEPLKNEEIKQSIDNVSAKRIQEVVGFLTSLISEDVEEEEERAVEAEHSTAELHKMKLRILSM